MSPGPHILPDDRAKGKEEFVGPELSHGSLSLSVCVCCVVCGVEWSGVEWSGVGVEWSGVEWSGVVSYCLRMGRRPGTVGTL